MDKSSNSSSTPPSDNPSTNNHSTLTVAENNNSTDHYLKHLNKLSHKITKQPPKKLSGNQTTSSHQNPPPPPPQQPPPPPHQPPVYNINKSDFRDVVQKLTGSPAHDRFSTAPPPILPSKNTTSSRLQKIRPPPLPQLRPPTADTRQQPLSPLPPFPSVHTAAESPISAYMRFIQGTDLRMEDWKRIWNHPNLVQEMPSSPLGFGCLASPKPLFSPTTLGFPLSPNVQQHSSPRWKKGV